MFAIMKLSDSKCNSGEEGISTQATATYTRYHRLKLRLPGSKQKVQASSLLSVAKRVCALWYITVMSGVSIVCSEHIPFCPACISSFHRGDNSLSTANTVLRWYRQCKAYDFHHNHRNITQTWQIPKFALLKKFWCKRKKESLHKKHIFSPFMWPSVWVLYQPTKPCSRLQMTTVLIPSESY